MAVQTNQLCSGSQSPQIIEIYNHLRMFLEQPAINRSFIPSHLRDDMLIDFSQMSKNDVGEWLYKFYIARNGNAQITGKAVGMILENVHSIYLAQHFVGRYMVYRSCIELLAESDFDKWFGKIENRLCLPTPYAHNLLSKTKPKISKKEKRSQNWYDKFFVEKCTTMTPSKKCRKYNPTKDEHTHNCPYCKLRYFCKCDKKKDLKGNCPYASCKFYGECPEISRRIEYHVVLRDAFAKSPVKQYPDIIHACLKESLQKGCDCVWVQLDTRFRGNFINTGNCYYFRETGVPGHIRVPIVPRPDEDRLIRQSNVIRESARANCKNNERRVQNFANTFADRSWVRQFHGVKNPAPPKLLETLDFNLIRLFTDVIEVEQKVSKKQKKPIKKVRPEKVIVKVQKQLQRIESLYLESQIKMVEQELKDLKMSREEIQEALIEERQTKQFRRYKTDIHQDFDKMVDKLFADLRKKAGTIKFTDKTQPQFEVMNGDLLYKGKFICKQDDKNMLSIAFSKIYDKKYDVDMYEYQAEFLEPIKAMIANMVHTTVNSSKLVKAALISRLCSFVLSMGSSCVALIDSIHDKRGWMRISIHVLSICAQISDMIIGLMVAIQYMNVKNIAVDNNFSKTMAASIIHLLIEQNMIPEDKINEILQAADIEEAIIAPSRESIIALNKPLEDLPPLTCKTLRERMDDKYNHYATCLLHGIETIPVGNNTLSVLMFDPISTYRELYDFLDSPTNDVSAKMSFILQIIVFKIRSSSCFMDLINDGIFACLVNAFDHFYKTADLIDPQFSLDPNVTYLVKVFHLVDDFASEDIRYRAIRKGDTFDDSCINIDDEIPFKLRHHGTTMFDLTLPFEYQAFRVDMLLSFVSLLAAAGISIFDWRSAKSEVPLGKAIVLGSSVNKSLHDSFKSTKSYIEDCSYEFFGYVIGDKYNLKVKGKEYLDKLQFYKEAENGLYCQNPEMVLECKKLIAEIKSFTSGIALNSKDLSAGDTELVRLINASITLTEQKIVQVEAVLTTLGTKPTTFYDCFWGEKGCGKTTFVNQYYCPEVCKRMRWDNGVYNIAFNDDGNSYWPEYAQQRIAKVDDFLKNGYKDKLLAKAQEFFGNNLCNMEGAYAKNQKNNNIALVGMSSNHASFNLPAGNERGLTETGCEAVFGRGRWYHVYNMHQWDNSGNYINIEREDMKYRSDYKHLRFFEYYFPNVSVWRAHELMEAGKGRFPRIDPDFKYTLTLSDTGVRTFTHDTNKTHYTVGEWYKININSTDGYIKEYTIDSIIDRAVLRIKAEEDKYKVFLRQLAIRHIGDIPKRDLPTKDVLCNQLALKGVKKEIIEDVLKTEFPGYYHSRGTAATSHCTILFSGPTGVGKSLLCEKVLVPEIQKMLPRMKYFNIKSIKEARSVQSPAIVQLDDQILKEDGQLFMDIMHSLPSPCLLLMTENIYVKKLTLPWMVLPRSQTNIKDVPLFKKFISYFVNLRPINVNTIYRKKNNILQPVDMHEGWYRRVGISGYNTSALAAKASQSDCNKCYAYFIGCLITLGLSNVAFYFLGYLFFGLNVPLYMFMSYICQFILPETLPIPYVNDDYSAHFEMESFGQARHMSDNKLYLDNAVADVVFQKYLNCVNTLNTIRVERASERVGRYECDVFISAPCMTELPAFINNKRKVFENITFGPPKLRDYEVALSKRVAQSTFTTCVSDFKLDTNVDEDQVIAMAKRTYAVLLQAGSDMSVTVKTGDFEVFAHNGIIKYWHESQGCDYIWAFEDVPLSDLNDKKSVRCSYIANGQIEAEYVLSYDSLIRIYLGDIKDHPNINGKLMKALWEHKAEISKLSPYEERHNIKLAASAQTMDMVSHLQLAKDHYINRQANVVGAIILGVTGLVTICGIGTLIWSMFAKPVSYKEIDKFKTINKKILGINPLKFDFAWQGMPTSVICTLTIEDVYNLNVEVQHRCAKLDSSGISDLKVVFINLLKSRLQIDDEDFKKLIIKYQFCEVVDEAVLQSQPSSIKSLASKVVRLIKFQEVPDNVSDINVKIAYRNQTEDLWIYDTVRLTFEKHEGILCLCHVESNTDGVIWSPEHTDLLSNLLDVESLQGKSTIIEYQENTPAKGINKKKDRKRQEVVTYFNNTIDDHSIVISQNDKGTLELICKPMGVKPQAVNTIKPLNSRSPNMEIALEKQRTNIVQVFNNVTNVAVYGMGFADRFIITNYHAFPEINGMFDDAIVYLDDPKEIGATLRIAAQVVHCDKDNDIVILGIDKHQGFRFKQIISSYVREEDISRVSEGAFARCAGDGLDVIRSNCTLNSIKRKVLVRNGDELDQLEMRLVVHRFLTNTFVTATGDCGHPYLVNVPGKSANSPGNWVLAGMHSFGNAWQASGPLVTQEMLTHYYSVVNDILPLESQSASLDNINELAVMKCRDIVDINMSKPTIVFGDREVVEVLRANEYILPKHDWPLFKANKYDYGVVDHSNLSYIGYVPKFSNSSLGTHSHRPVPWIKELCDEFNISSPVNNTQFNPFEVEDKSQLLFSRPTPNSESRPSIIYTQISYYNDYVREHSEFNSIVEEVTEELKPLFVQWFGSKHHRILSDCEVLNGLVCRNDTFYGALDGMDLNSSPGYFCGTHLGVSKRKGLLELDEVRMKEFSPINGGRFLYKYNNTPAGQRMQRRYLRKYELAAKGIWYAPIAKDSLKDELVKNASVKIGKTRVFVACDEADNLFARKVLGTYCAIQKQRHLSRHCSVGVDAYKEFHVLDQRLRKTSSLGEAGDFKHWDKNLNRTVLFNVLQCIKHAITYYMDENEKRRYDNFFKIIYLDMTHGFSIADGIVYQRHRGMPSGHLTTASVNSDCNFFYHLVVCKILLRKYNQVERPIESYPTTVAYIVQMTDMIAYGDDKKTAIHESLISIINFKTIQAVFLEYFGLQYTLPDKGEGIYQVKPLEELDYLSRCFRPSPTNVVFPTLKESSLLGMMLWCTGITAEIIGNTLKNCRMELQLLNKDRYEVLVPIFHRAVDYYSEHFNMSDVIYLPSYEVNLALTTQSILQR